ncbi:MAG: hypothetical protein ABI895_30650 [Deltaproteobacteria bacterium]
MLRLGGRSAHTLGVLSLSFALWGRPAAAQSDSAAARALFSEGRQLMGAEKYAEACPKFEESLRLDPGMGTQFNLAHCWDKLGRSASAWALFLDVAAAARAGNQPQREAAAKERAAALEPKLTRLRVVVPEPAPDAKIFRDDQEVGRAAWGTAMPVDPGDHVIRVTAAGKKEWTQDVKVPPTSRTFSVTVPTLEDQPVAKEAAAAPQKQDVARDTAPLRDRGSGGGGANVPALVIGGIGIAALATGTVFALQGYSDNQEALKLCRVGAEKKDCPNSSESERHEKLVDDAKREQLIGLVTLGVGGAAVVTATIILLTSGGDSREQAALELVPAWLDGGWGASLSGRF